VNSHSLLVRGLISLVVLLESVLLLLVGGADVFGRATSPETWASGFVWLVAGVLGGYVVVKLLRPSTVDQVTRQGWWLLSVQLGTLTLLYYAYWVESTSHVDHWSAVLLPALLVPVLLGLYGFVQANRRRDSLTTADGRPDWRAAISEGRLQAVAALIGVLGSASVLVVEKVYLPTHDVPTVNIAATMNQIGRTGDEVLLQATITLTNVGAAPTTVLGSLYRITGHLFTAPTANDVPGQTEAIDGRGPDVHRFPQRAGDINGTGVLQTDDVLLVTDVLMPGEVVTRTFTFRGSAASEQYARLDADVLVMTGRPGPAASHRCEQQADRVGDDSTDYSSVCWETDVPTRNTIHRLLDDDLRVQSVVVVRDPRQGQVPQPYLNAIFTSGGVDKIDRIDLWQANFIAQVHTRTEYAYTPAVDSAPTQPSR
jgi:hypothetical protein